MTEAEWNACTDPVVMLESLRGNATSDFEEATKGNNRKCRLFACACCRRIWDWIKDARSQKAVDVAERFADGVASEEERMCQCAAAANAENDAQRTKQSALYGSEDNPEWTHEWQDSLEITHAASRAATQAVADDASDASRLALWVLAKTLNGEWEARYSLGQQKWTSLLRDIFGPLPFRTVTLNPAWRTSNVTALAQAIYDDRAFDRLPILADALEDAGCDNADILNHCRQPGEHVRGCWVVDLLLQKE
jgi:hypothetical protein